MRIGPTTDDCIRLYGSAYSAHQIGFDGTNYTFECRPRPTVTRESCPSCFASPQQEVAISIAKATGLPVHQYTSPSGVYSWRIGECPKGQTINPYGANCIEGFRDEFKPGEYFKDVAIAAVQTAALVGSAGTLTPLTAAATYGGQLVSTLQQGGALNMGLDLGGIFGSVAQAVGGLSSGNYWQALQGGLGAASAAFAPSPMMMPVAQPVYGPVYSPPAPASPPAVIAQPVGAFGVAARAIATLTAPILQKIAVKLGLRARPSLSRAMDMVRKAAKLLTSPEAVAAALGITVGELATLITTSNSRKRRRMNPANSKALRRAARRIKSFHRLCTHTDVLRGRGRSARRVSACGTCKKSPCRC